MATHPQLPLTPEEVAELRRLIAWTGLEEPEALHKLVEAGLAALRLEAALHLYATAPLSTGEIAEQTGIPRGQLIRTIQERRVAPYEDPTIDQPALYRDLDERLKRRVARWKGQA